MSQMSLLANEGIWALRNVDYSTYYALGEIVDNSLQWNASKVHIIAIQEPVQLTSRTVNRLTQVLIYDDGDGMSAQTLSKALQYGGGLNGPGSQKMGKFGMGLPNASGSQSVRTEVYSWQSKSVCNWNVLDFEELAASHAPGIGPAKRKNVPTRIKKLIPGFCEDHGTIVHWANCDKITHRTVPYFTRDLEHFLGRVYRYFIHRDGKQIHYSAFKSVGGKFRALKDYAPREVRANDPLFLMTPCCLPDYEHEVTNEIEGAERTQVLVPSVNKTYDIRIKCSLVKALHQKKTFKGTGKQNTHYGTLSGISLIRAGRELKLDNFGFIDRIDTRERWWAVEVEFGPELDGHFGVTNDKQEARGFRYVTSDRYNEILENGADEADELMYELSKLIDRRIKDMWSQIKDRKLPPQPTKCPKCKEVTVAGGVCTACGWVSVTCAIHSTQELSDGVCPLCRIIPPPPPEPRCPEHGSILVDGVCKQCEKRKKTKKPRRIEPEVLDRLKKYLRSMYDECKDEGVLSPIVNHLLQTSMSHTFIQLSVPGLPFMTYELFSADPTDIVLITINRRHPFYDKYWHAHESRGEAAPLQMFMASQVLAQQQFPDTHEEFVLYNQQQSIQLAQLMKHYTPPSD